MLLANPAYAESVLDVCIAGMNLVALGLAVFATLLAVQARLDPSLTLLAKYDFAINLQELYVEKIFHFWLENEKLF